jgi:D-alanyl-D-alanine carboxypeptidase/D-alanyl-D-alanine-endopeptidase (penicillin-binding protein 4)
MRAASSPPEPTLRPGAVIAALLAGALTISSAPGPLGFLDRDGRTPPQRVEHSHVIEAPATAQVLIPAPADVAPPSPQTQVSPPTPASVAELPVPPPPPPPVAAPAAPAPTPPAAAALAGLIGARLADPRLAGTTVGLSVWADGLGEVASHNADVPLTPASNQKLFTAMGVLSLVPQTDRLVTEARATGAQDGRVLAGDLYLVGGGDPTLNARGAHSLDDLAAAVKARGINEVRGAIVGDETRYDTVRGAPGWLAQHVPVFIGPLSALVVDRNQLRPDADYAANPLPGTLAYFRAALLRAGVRVAGPNVAGAAPATSAVLAALASPPIGDLVGEMLNQSDNLIAELLVKEVGYRAGRKAATGSGATGTGGGSGGAAVAGSAGPGRPGWAPGSTAGGLAAMNEAVRGLGVPLAGVAADGSGLSRQDRRSAREWRSLLQAALPRPWAERLVGSLPLGGRTGTLARRFARTAAEANVRAKTGWIDEARSLSGYLTTAGGRQVVFSVVVNGTTPTSPALNALDGLVAAIAADRS